MPSMLVLLDLHFDSQAEQSGARQNSQSMYFWTPEQRMEMIKVVEAAQDIWAGLAETSMEAVKANQITKIMLEKIRNPTAKPCSAAAEQPAAAAPAMFDGMSDAELQPEQSAAMTLGMMSSGGLTPNTAAAFGANTVQSPGGTTYPAIDPGLGIIGERTGMTPDFSGDLGMAPNSPFSSMFNSMGNNMGMGMGQNFDWVSDSAEKLCNQKLTICVLRMPYKATQKILRGARMGNFKRSFLVIKAAQLEIHPPAVANIHSAPHQAAQSRAARKGGGGWGTNLVCMDWTGRMCYHHGCTLILYPSHLLSFFT